jgi:DNA gyrase subunit B
MRRNVQDKTFLQDSEKMARLKKAIQQEGYLVEDLVLNPEDGMYAMTVQSTDANAVQQRMIVDRRLIYDSDYQKSLVLSRKVAVYDHPPFKIYSRDAEGDAVVVKDLRHLLHHLIEEGKKGIHIQRYKGLGEMNPEQLWQTTMHPDKRHLMKVTVEDAVESDEIFTILMGDEVEPRREFIQNNALEVSMLDI